MTVNFFTVSLARMSFIAVNLAEVSHVHMYHEVVLIDSDLHPLHKQRNRNEEFPGHCFRIVCAEDFDSYERLDQVFYQLDESLPLLEAALTSGSCRRNETFIYS